MSLLLGTFVLVLGIIWRPVLAAGRSPARQAEEAALRGRLVRRPAKSPKPRRC